MSLPRGLSNRSVGSPVATARWASPTEMSRYRYRRGDIWLGVLPVPHAEARATLDKLQQLRARLVAETELSEDWRRQQLAACDGHLAALNATDELEIGMRDDRHLLTVASTRAGKGTSVIVPNLRRYPGSVICIDPKGENARLTAGRRGHGEAGADGMGQTVCILDPYNTTGMAAELRAGWNPLDLLDPEDEQIIDRAAAIADALIVRAKSEDAHFDESARIFVKALILYVALVLHDHPACNLITVYDLLMRGAVAQLAADRAQAEDDSLADLDAFTYLLRLMEREVRCGGVIAGAATMIMGMGDRERGAVLSTARRNLEFIERTPMQRVLRASSFDIDALKTDAGGMTVYLCLPPQRMSDCGRWLRLMVTVCLERLYEIPAEPVTGHPVLFLLEEFASLGHLQVIEHAAGYAAGFGVKLWVIIQDLTQLKRHYREAWETFVGNAGVIQAFASGDATTLDYLSKKLGEGELVQTVRNLNTSYSTASNDPGAYHRMQGLLANRGQLAPLTNVMGLLVDAESTSQSASTSTAHNEQIQRTPLLLPDELERTFRRETMNQLILIKGERPFVLNRRPFYLESPSHSQTDQRPTKASTNSTQPAWQQSVAGAEDFIQNLHKAFSSTRKRRR